MKARPSKAGLRYSATSTLARFPWLYFGLRRLVGGHPPNLISGDTELVIEGFPRSGNSFAVRAFRHANPGVCIAHHTHAPAQLLLARRRRIPALIIVRDPDSAVRSFLARRPEIAPGQALKAWINYHRTVARCRDHAQVSEFGQLTSDFGAIVSQLNTRFGTRFARFRHTPENIEAVFSEMDRVNVAAYDGKLRTTHVPRPHPERDRLKGRIDLSRHHERLCEARKLYLNLISS